MRIQNEEKQSKKPKHYARISTKRRQQLVDLVLQKKYSVGRAAHRLKLKLSTAKMIIKKYKESGSFFEKKFEKKRTGETSKKESKKAQQQNENFEQNVQNMPVKKQEEVVGPIIIQPNEPTNKEQQPTQTTLCPQQLSFFQAQSPYSNPGFLVSMSHPWMYHMYY